MARSSRRTGIVFCHAYQPCASRFNSACTVGTLTGLLSSRASSSSRPARRSRFALNDGKAGVAGALAYSPIVSPNIPNRLRAATTSPAQPPAHAQAAARQTPQKGRRRAANSIFGREKVRQLHATGTPLQIAHIHQLLVNRKQAGNLRTPRQLATGVNRPLVKEGLFMR
jgi:hypothetical protein